MTEPRPIAELIVDTFVGHAVNLQRLTAGERRTIFKMLGKLQQELLAALTASDIDQKSNFQQRRLKALFTTVTELVTTRYAKIATTHRDRLVQIAEVVSDQTVRLTNAQIGAPLLSVGAPIEVLRALANDKIVQGRPAEEWWTQQKNNLRGRFQNTIRQGVFAGETLGDLLRRVRGTRERRFQDGIMAITSREAEALIRTSVQSVANAARYETYQMNDDVIAGQQWLSTLDNRTTETCMALSGQAWDLQGRPIGDATRAFPGPPPIHWNCRSTLVPVLKSWEQLAIEAKGDAKLGKKLGRIENKINKGKQASIDGQVSADFTYVEWLARRPEAEQKEILGAGKWQLWKDDKIGLTDMINFAGRPLTLEELKASVA